MDLKKMDVDYLVNLHTDRLQEKSSKHKGGSVEEVSTVSATNKIYVFPNCKIKKLPLRKWIKDIGAKQVFKVSEADCLIVKKDLVTDIYDRYPFSIEIINHWLLPKGDYFSERKNEVYRSVIEDIWTRDAEMKYFMFQTYYARNDWDSPLPHETDIINSRLYNHWESKYKINCKHKQMTEEHVSSLLNKSNLLINEVDLQQVVYNWEVKKDIRDDLVSYEWDNLYQILCGENTWNLAIMMIKKGNVESMLSKLVACYYDDNIPTDAKLALYDKVFIRKPDLRQCIQRNSVHNSWRSIRRKIEELFQEVKCNNQELELEAFKEILGVTVKDMGNKYYVE